MGNDVLYWYEASPDRGSHAKTQVEMSPALANVICACGICGLFYLDRDRSERTSYALWIPGLWIGIIGSRTISLWFGFEGGGNLGLDGSPVDAAVFGVLIALGMLVLAGRASQTRTLLAANKPIVIYFLFCLVSIAWSPHPDVSLKRWIKAIGDLIMALIIVTDRAPLAAFSRLVSRLGMVLFPTSVLFIYYYGELGRISSDEGEPMNIGVATTKNLLGLTVLLITLAVLWNVRRLYIHKDEPNRGRRLVAQGTILAFGLALLHLANCSTCKACFLLGVFLVFSLSSEAFRRQPARVHTLCLGMIIAGGMFFFLGGRGAIANALGRQASFSGRTEIWSAVISSTSNPILGDGFESFWNSEGADKARQKLVNEGFDPHHMAQLQEAHNGYIEIYLQTGLVGLCLISFVLFSGYKRAFAAYRLNPELGSLFIAYVAQATMYGVTEAGFRTMSANQIFLLTMIVSSTAVTAGLIDPEGSFAPPEVAELTTPDQNKICLGPKYSDSRSGS